MLLLLLVLFFWEVVRVGRMINERRNRGRKNGKKDEEKDGKTAYREA